MPSPYTKYREYKPSPILTPYICCYWSAIPYKKQKAEYTYEIIPDGCTDILFEYDQMSQTSSLKYYGIFESCFKTTEQYNPSKITFGIRFYPGSSAYFISERAKDTAGNSIDLNHLNTLAINRLRHKLHDVKSINNMIATCDEIFTQAIIEKSFLYQDSLLNNILYRIVTERGNISVKELSNKEVIGQRMMNRLFEERIGISPKRFSQVIRFQSVLTDLLYKSPSEFIADEYYDQSHMIKDFKRRIGNKPSSIKMSDFYNTIFQPPDKI